MLHFLWKSGSQSLEEERRGTESTLLEVQCKVSTVSDGLGCHVICWCWSTVFSEVQGQHSRIPGSFRALHASCCWPTLWRCRFHFPTGVGTCTQCQSYLSYLIDRKSMGYCEEEDVICQTQQCRRAEGHYQSNLGSHNTWAVPQTDRLHATPHCCSNSGKRSPN